MVTGEWLSKTFGLSVYGCRSVTNICSSKPWRESSGKTTIIVQFCVACCAIVEKIHHIKYALYIQHIHK